MMGPKVYVVLLVHNRKEVTAKFVRCVLEQTYKNYHLILVDDGSTDGTADFVRERVAALSVLHGDGNLWWAGALSRAYEYLSQNEPSEHNIVLIMSDDMTFNAAYFQTVVSDEDLAPGAPVVPPGQLVSAQDGDSCHPPTEWGLAIDWPSLSTRLVQQGEEVDAATTPGLYMLYSTYRSLGPLHRHLLPHYLSKLEYTIRAKRRGLKVLPSKRSEVLVDRSTTGSHRDEATTLREFLYNHLVSKKTAYNSTTLNTGTILFCWQLPGRTSPAHCTRSTFASCQSWLDSSGVRTFTRCAKAPVPSMRLLRHGHSPARCQDATPAKHAGLPPAFWKRLPEPSGWQGVK
jgi:GT2 family glycosyltransferase